MRRIRALLWLELRERWAHLHVVMLLLSWAMVAVALLGSAEGESSVMPFVGILLLALALTFAGSDSPATAIRGNFPRAPLPNLPVHAACRRCVQFAAGAASLGVLGSVVLGAVTAVAWVLLGEPSGFERHLALLSCAAPAGATGARLIGTRPQMDWRALILVAGLCEVGFALRDHTAWMLAWSAAATGLALLWPERRWRRPARQIRASRGVGPLGKAGRSPILALWQLQLRRMPIGLLGAGVVFPAVAVMTNDPPRALELTALLVAVLMVAQPPVPFGVVGSGVELLVRLPVAPRTAFLHALLCLVPAFLVGVGPLAVLAWLLGISPDLVSAGVAVLIWLTWGPLLRTAQMGPLFRDPARRRVPGILAVVLPVTLVVTWVTSYMRAVLDDDPPPGDALAILAIAAFGVSICVGLWAAAGLEPAARRSG